MLINPQICAQYATYIGPVKMYGCSLWRKHEPIFHITKLLINTSSVPSPWPTLPLHRTPAADTAERGHKERHNRDQAQANYPRCPAGDHTSVTLKMTEHVGKRPVSHGRLSCGRRSTLAQAESKPLRFHHLHRLDYSSSWAPGATDV